MLTTAPYACDAVPNVMLIAVVLHEESGLGKAGAAEGWEGGWRRADCIFSSQRQPGRGGSCAGACSCRREVVGWWGALGVPYYLYSARCDSWMMRAHGGMDGVRGMVRRREMGGVVRDTRHCTVAWDRPARPAPRSVSLLPAVAPLSPHCTCTLLKGGHSALSQLPTPGGDAHRPPLPPGGGPALPPARIHCRAEQADAPAGHLVIHTSMPSQTSLVWSGVERLIRRLRAR